MTEEWPNPLDPNEVVKEAKSVLQEALAGGLSDLLDAQDDEGDIITSWGSDGEQKAKWRVHISVEQVDEPVIVSSRTAEEQADILDAEADRG